MRQKKNARDMGVDIPGFASEEERLAELKAIHASGMSKPRIAMFAARNFRLVLEVAQRYVRVYPELDFEDLCQEGYIGLIRAAEKFEPERGLHFSTYAMWWVRQMMLRAIHETMFVRPFRLSTAVEQDLMDLRNRVAYFASRHGGQQPTQKEQEQLIVEWLEGRRKKRAKPMRNGLGKANTLIALAGLYKEYLDAPVSGRIGETRSLGDMVADSGRASDEGAMDVEAQREALTITFSVAVLLARLLNEGRISSSWHVELYWQHMEEDEEDLSGSELAQMFYCSRQRVSQVIHRLSKHVQLSLGYTPEVVAAAAQLRLVGTCAP